MGMHMIVLGNPSEGFRYYGPFKTFDDALRYAERNDRGIEGDWWILPLYHESDLEAKAA